MFSAKCNKCGKKISPNDKFCPYCGSPCIPPEPPVSRSEILEPEVPAPAPKLPEVSEMGQEQSKEKSGRKVPYPALLAVILVVILGAAGVLIFRSVSQVSATTMHLRKTEGTVGVSDDGGKEVAILENLGLYSGYGVDTQTESYAWIDLDEVKLTKMDQDSEIAITKEGKKLEIEVKSGNLFFNVTQPLADDESMNIRTSTMIIGIRGTCGWVVSDEDRGAQVFILEGAVEVQDAATGERVQVNSGETAWVMTSEDGETEIIVRPFFEEYIPPFVVTELESDGALCAAILEDSGLDVLNPQDPVERLRAEYLDIINSRAILDFGAANAYTVNGMTYSNEGLSYAAIVDLDGNGMDELILVTRRGQVDDINAVTKLEFYGDLLGHAALYGEADFLKMQEEYNWDGISRNPNEFYLTESDGRIYAVAQYAIQYVGHSFVYTVENNEVILVEHTEGGDSQYRSTESSLDLTEALDICPPLPDDARMKNALLSCTETYGSPTFYCFARLADTDLYLLEDQGVFWKCSWNGTAMDWSSLEEDIIYAKLIDMDQDGEDELLLILEDTSAVAYSWRGNSYERIPIHESVLTFPYEGLYWDTEAGDVYLGDREWFHIGEGEGYSFSGLTERFDYSYSAGDFSANGGNFVDELTPDELEEFSKAQEQYNRDLERFELIESIPDLYQQGSNLSEFYEQGRSTVDEVRRQLMER